MVKLFNKLVPFKVHINLMSKQRTWTDQIGEEVNDVLQDVRLQKGDADISAAELQNAVNLGKHFVHHPDCWGVSSG